MQERDSSPQETRLFANIPEVQEYRALYARALDTVRMYTGTEDSYNTVSNVLVELEQKALSLKLAPSLTIPQQEKITANIAIPHHKGKLQGIDNLLSIAIAADSVRHVIHEALHGGRRENERSPLFIRRIAGILIPPSDHPRVIPGEGKFEPARFEERLFELTLLLARERIFLDDCIVTIGSLLPRQIRQLSYALVEIPRIDRSILVCDQVGEATFVVHGLGDPNRYLTMTKEQLRATLGTTVRRIVHRNDQQWLSDLGILLFTEQGWCETSERNLEQHGLRHETPSRPKFDVRNFAAVRDAILASNYDTLEKWIHMSKDQAEKFKLTALGNIGLTAMARILGVEGNPVQDKRIRLECAQKLFGYNEQLAEEMGIERERQEKRRLAENAPPGWQTRVALAKKIGVERATLEKRITHHLAEHPEWEHEYLNIQRSLFPHLSPELCALVHEELKGYSEEKKLAENSPPGWQTRGALKKELGVDRAMLEEHISPHLAERPEWEHEYLNMQERLFPHLSPELCALVHEELKSYSEKKKIAEKAPPGWQTRKALKKELGVSSETLKKHLAPHLAERPEWEHEYLNIQRSLFPHLSPELCALVHEELKGYSEEKKLAENSPPGWQTRGALKKELGVSSETLKKRLAPHLLQHPEWEHEYLNMIGNLYPHLSPELCALVHEELKGYRRKE